MGYRFKQFRGFHFYFHYRRRLLDIFTLRNRTYRLVTISIVRWKRKKRFLIGEESLKVETLRPHFIIRLKSIDYNEESLLKNTIKTTDEEAKFVFNQYKFFESSLHDYDKSDFHDFESYLRTKKLMRKIVNGNFNYLCLFSYFCVTTKNIWSDK